MCTLCQARTPENAVYEFHTDPTVLPPELGGVVEDPVVNNTSNTSNTVESGSYNSNLPVYSLDQIADFLTDDYWQSVGRSSRSFSLDSSRTLDVDITGLTSTGKALARAALDTWTDVSGIKFREVSFGADITFDDEDSGAYAQSFLWGDRITSSFVNISTGWLASQGSSLTSYSFQTYIHEIGHALGLGHAGSYNGWAQYPYDANYANDSWQATVMSYFSDYENNYVDADFRYVVTPQMADILAIQNLYGVPTDVRSGNTTYGTDATSDANVDILGSNAVTIFDSGGVDLINLTSSGSNQRLDLNEEAFSDLNARIGNFAIARGAEIENARLGTGNDVVIGNGLANYIHAGGGDDVIYGGAQYDTIFSSTGDDIVHGGAGQDWVDLGSGNDVFYDVAQTGKNGRDTVYGEAGNDTIFGEGGGDNLYGGVGSDLIYGGAENDKIYGSSGDDTIYGGADDDTIFGGHDNDLIYGDNGDDVIDGGSQNDVIYAGDGDDVVRGGAGQDIIRLDHGNDVFIDDEQGGSHGRDAVFGGKGNDTFVSGGGNDRFYGGWGNDIFQFSRGMDVDIIRNFQDDADTVFLDTDLTGGVEKSASQLFADYGTTYGGSVALDFGSNDFIVFDGISDQTDLYDDIFYL